MVIPPRSHGVVPILDMNLPDNRDLFFEPTYNRAAVYAHVVDHHVSEILVRNKLVIPRKSKMGNIVEYEAEGCYHISSKAGYLAATSTKAEQRDDWIRRQMRDTLVTAALQIDQSNEHRLPNEITLYGEDVGTVKKLKQVVDEFPRLWQDNGNVVDIPEEEWMEIPLVDDWRERYKPGQARVYSVGHVDREIINKAFDKLQMQK